jgi:hypothetical protein
VTADDPRVARKYLRPDAIVFLVVRKWEEIAQETRAAAPSMKNLRARSLTCATPDLEALPRTCLGSIRARPWFPILTAPDYAARGVAIEISSLTLLGLLELGSGGGTTPRTSAFRDDPGRLVSDRCWR